MFKYILLWSLLLSQFGNMTVFAQDDTVKDAYFIYVRRSYTSQNEISEVSIDITDLDDNIQASYTVDSVHYYALSPQNSYLTISGHDGTVSIINLVSEETVSLKFPINTAAQLIYDEYSIQAGTLHWSFDETQLAYVVPTSATTNHIYVYNLIEDTYINLTENIPLQGRSGISSWSPDGQWISFIGTWNTDDQQHYLRQTGFISLQTQELIELPLNHVTCRMIWSPNMDYIASTSLCYDTSGQTASLLWFPFNETIDNLSITQLNINLADNHSFYPVWMGDNKLKVSFLDYQSVSRVIYDALSGIILEETEFTPAITGAFHYQNWLYSTVLMDGDQYQYIVAGFALDTGDSFELESLDGVCISRHIRTLNSQNLVAILRGCDINAASNIQIYDFSTNKLLLTIQAESDEQLEPIGFF